MTRGPMRSAFDDIPEGRPILAVAFVHTLVEYGVWLAVAVVAFDNGGASEAGVAAAAQLIPAALVAPAVAASGDRFARDRVLTAAMAMLAICAFGIAAALAVDAPLAVVYALAACFTSALTAAPATLASLLVRHSRTPTQLTMFNGALTSVRAAGSLLGPLSTAALLALWSPEGAFAAVGVVCIMGAVLVLSFVPNDDRVPTSLRLRDIRGETVSGLAHVLDVVPLRRSLSFLAMTRVLVGALDVIILAVAYTSLAGDGSTASILAGCLAAGSVIASIAYSTVTGRRPALARLALTATVGGVVLAVPLAGVLVSDRLVPVVSVILVIGMGKVLVEIGGHTILQRAADESLTSRVFGVLDSTGMAAEALGAFLMGILIAEAGLDNSIVTFVLVGVAGVVALGYGLQATEQSTAVVDPELVATLRSVPFFSTLSLPTLERLARGTVLRQVDRGDRLIRQGDIGDDFFVLLDGEVSVEIDDTIVREAAPPDFFGEIALLRSSMRTATVTAITPTTVGVIGRDPFLTAVIGSRSSHRSAEDIVSTRLAPD